MKRYIIERDLPGVGKLNGLELSAASAKSNEALAQLTGRVQWVQSFVAGDKTFCVYRADSEDSIHAHARLSGFPATRITPVPTIFDPTTAR